MSNAYQEVAHNGLWKNNPGLVQLLGLCPLMAVSNSVVNALGLGLATAAVLACSNLLVSLFRNQVISAIRLPYQTLGIFIPLIVTNCVLLGRAEGFASKNSPALATFDGLMMGCGFMAVLLVLGFIRELLGTGAVFANMEQLLPFAASWKLQVFTTDTPFLLAILPPGSFLVLGFLIALKKVIDKRQTQAKVVTPVEPSATGSKRVRVTGQV
jgi:Na+-translocating ferredoxin:NAD+ oxidoreductase subunit E